MYPPIDPEPELYDPTPPPITQLTFERVVNLGNYENQRLAATATVVPGDDPAAIYRTLRAFVETQLGLHPPPGPTHPQMAPPPGYNEHEDLDF